MDSPELEANSICADERGRNNDAHIDTGQQKLTNSDSDHHDAEEEELEPLATVDVSPVREEDFFPEGLTQDVAEPVRGPRITYSLLLLKINPVAEVEVNRAQDFRSNKTNADSTSQHNVVNLTNAAEDLAGTSLKKTKLTTADYSRRYREKVKLNPDLYKKDNSLQRVRNYRARKKSQLSSKSQSKNDLGLRVKKNSTHRTRAYRERQKLLRFLQEENCNSIIQLPSSSQSSIQHECHVQNTFAVSPVIPEVKLQYHDEKSAKTSSKSDIQKTLSAAEYGRRYREKVKANPDLYPKDYSTKRTRAYRARKKLQKLHAVNHEKIQLLPLQETVLVPQESCTLKLEQSESTELHSHQ